MGEEVNNTTLGTFTKICENTHSKLKEQLNLPENFEDPELRCGYIPFAKLKNDINTNELTNHLLKCKTKSKNQWELFKNDR